MWEWFENNETAVLDEEHESQFNKKNVAETSTEVDSAVAPLENTPEHPLYEKVIEGLKQIYDPEIPVNIYDLGLIYVVHISAENDVIIHMTLTAPACPVAQTFPGMVETTIANIEEVNSAKVHLVWDPPWTKDHMSEAAKLQLGFL